MFRACNAGVVNISRVNCAFGDLTNLQVLPDIYSSSSCNVANDSKGLKRSRIVEAKSMI